MEELIEKYLLGQLSKEEKLNFEQRIKIDANLAKEVRVQRDLMEVIKIQGLKADIGNAWDQVLFERKIKTTIISFLIVAILSLGIYHITHRAPKSKTLNPQSTSVVTLADSTNSVLAENVKSKQDEQIPDTILDRIQSIPSDPIKNEERIDDKIISIVSHIKHDNKLIEVVDKVDSITKSKTIDIPIAPSSPPLTDKSKSAESNQLLTLVQTKYPTVYSNIINEFDLSDSTLSTSVCEYLCNFKKATHIRIGNSKTTKDFPLEHSSTWAKRKEVKELYKASFRDCSCN